MFRLFIAVMLSLTCAGTVQASPLVEVMKAVRADKWEEAEELAKSGDHVLQDIVEWRRLRAGLGSFDEYRDFLSSNPDWPGLDRIRAWAETEMGANADPEEVLDFFSAAPPATGVGAVRLAMAYRAMGLQAEAEQLALDTWRTQPMEQAEQDILLSAFAPLLEPHHEARLDALLWRGATPSARRMFPLVNDSWRKLADARIALRKRENGVDARINAVPDELADNPGLAWERFDWRASKGLTDSAIELIFDRSISVEHLGEPERWAKRRAIYARRLMREGAHERAYDLAANNFLTEGSTYADLEWLAGYIALRFLNAPAVASAHFARFSAAVQTPISLGRAGYWQGRALEAANKPDAAQVVYAQAGQYQTGFYGQLAAEKAGVAPDPQLAGQDRPPNWQQAAFTNSRLVQAAKLLSKAEERNLAEWFLTHLAESLDAEGRAQLAAMTLDWGEPHIALRIAKIAAGEGQVLPQAYFPLSELASDRHVVPTALVLSIARRESEFDPAVTSGAGARGLMQLMPGTARDVSREIGVAYRPAALLTEPDYNAQLGAAYLAELVETWGENVVLVSASYNAGPHRARSWIERFGDPRSQSVDVIDWIEHIPFTETRNYVMRVAESMWIYRARLKGQVGPLDLSRRLRGGF